MVTKLLAQIKNIKWGITKEEFKNVFSDRKWVNYHPKEKNAITFVETDNDVYISVSAFFIIRDNVHELANVTLSFYSTDYQRLNDNMSEGIFENNKKDLISIYGKPDYTNNNLPMELCVSKFMNWKTEDSIVTLTLQSSKDYNALLLSKNILSDISTISVPPSVSIRIVDVDKDKEISDYIISQSYKMKQTQSDELEKELAKFYVPMFQKTMKVSLIQAQDIFNDMLGRVKERLEKSDIKNLPDNYGDVILKEELTNKKLNCGLNRKRVEGVKDEDIKWWWNTPGLARDMALEMDAMVKLTTLHGLIEKKGLSEKEAWEKLPKHCPVFGDPYDSSDSTTKHEPLPFELKNRVNTYIEKRVKADYEQFKQDMEDSSSFNSLIRKEIKRGNL